MSAPEGSSLYLPGVEANHQPGIYADLVASARARNAEYSKIWDLFAFQQSFTIHLARFSQGVLRQPASISPALRELIAAYTSYQNECAFCTKAHAAAAGELLEDHDLVWTALRDLDRAALDDRTKVLLRFVGKVTKDLPAVGPEDVATLHAAGWDDEAIYYAITTCALFNFYNRWITATGVPEMSPEAHRQQGQSLATRGYIRD
ncbi:MAG TPA: peroxidase-related enzyme [Vicinamibacterales bacterium]